MAAVRVQLQLWRRLTCHGEWSANTSGSSLSQQLPGTHRSWPVGVAAGLVRGVEGGQRVSVCVSHQARGEQGGRGHLHARQTMSRGRR